MKAKFEELDVLKGAESFRAFNRSVSRFEFNWHYHPEYEITLIETGSGTRLVGDCYENYGPGDLVMIGKSLPHTWASDQVSKEKSSAIVIQFKEEMLEKLMELQEFEAIKKLLFRARLGLFFPKTAISEIRRLISDLPSLRGVEKFIQLIKILERLANQRSRSLASAYYIPVKGALNEKRITKVCQYIQKNSGEKISTPMLAALIHMTESAFCKFFKRATGKTCSAYVNEIRIGYACHLLVETDQSIADIGYRAGFESLTYFNRVFLKKKGIRPRDFRNKRVL